MDRQTLAFRLPGGGSTIRHEGLVELTDITATLLDAAGLDPRAALCEQKSAPFHDRIPGRSLLPIILGDSSDSVRDDVFSEYGGVWSLIETGRWKYVRYQEGPAAGREVLYDLKNDPRECLTEVNVWPVIGRNKDETFAEGAGSVALSDFYIDLISACLLLCPPWISHYSTQSIFNPATL
jgi:hypothetical protein